MCHLEDFTAGVGGGVVAPAVNFASGKVWRPGHAGGLLDFCSAFFLDLFEHHGEKVDHGSHSEDDFEINGGRGGEIREDGCL